MKRKSTSAFECSPEEHFRYFKTLIRESDRGTVLLSASRLDELLGELHRAYIRSVAPQDEKFINGLFAPFAPLSSFATKIDLAFAYGLISKIDRHEMNLIRALRNDAAHTTADFDFRIPYVKAQTLEFTAPKRVFQAFHQNMMEINIPPMTDEERKAVDSPSDDQTGTKLYFVLAGMCLGIVVMEKVTRILRGDLNRITS